MRLKLIEHFGRSFLRFWSVRIQIAASLLTGWLFVDPATLLSAWNMMPPAVRDLLPRNILSAIGAILFALNLLAILARGVKQPKLETSDGANDEA